MAKRPMKRAKSVWFFVTPHQHEAMRKIKQAGRYGLARSAILVRTEHALMDKPGGPLVEIRNVNIRGKKEERLFLTKRGEHARVL